MAGKRGHNEGSICQRGDGKWQGAVSIGYEAGQLKRKYCYGATRQEVAEKVTRLLADRQRGIQPMSDRLTVSRYLAVWLDNKRDTVRPRTYRSYLDAVRLHIEPYIGRVVLSRLAVTDVQMMMRGLSISGANPPTVKYSVRVLRIALNDAMRQEAVSRNVAGLARTPKVEKHRVTPMTPEQATALLAAACDDRMESIYAVAVSTGLRQGELLGLTWGDVDLDLGRLTVKAQLQRQGGTLQRVPLKTDESHRTLDLPAVAVSALKRQRMRQKEAKLLAGERWHDTPFVFTSTIGTPIDARNLIRKFHAALDRAGLPSTRFHDLRHSAASILLAFGASLHEVKETLGHSRISTTSDVYGHILDSARKGTATRMDRAFGAG